VLIGLLSTSAAPGGVDGLFHGGGLTSLGHQTGAAAISIVWTGVFTTLIGFAIKYTIGWRIPEDDEVDGIDAALHGESAYDLDGRSGLRTPVTAPSKTRSPEGALA
jgi:ammonium transporter, Amt family